MNRGLLWRFTQESLWLFVLAIVVIFVFELLFIRAITEVDIDLLQRVVQLPFVQRILQAVSGAAMVNGLTATGIATLGYAHPFLYMVTWALLLTQCTRTLVGEIDRGSADVLLALPVSRAAVYISTTAVWLAGVLLFAIIPAVGIWSATHIFTLHQPVDLERIFSLYPNFLAFTLAIAGLTSCISAFSIRRGRTIAIVLGYLLFSFLLNYLATLWPFVANFAFLGLLHYYQPMEQTATGVFAAQDCAILLAIGVVAWTLGLLRFQRRDIPA